MPMHHMLEEMLNEYIVAASLQRGLRLFESVNALGTAVTVELLTPTTPGLRFGSGPQGSRLSHPRWMSHLAATGINDLPGERRPARARPTDGGT